MLRSDFLKRLALGWVGIKTALSEREGVVREAQRVGEAQRLGEASGDGVMSYSFSEPGTYTLRYNVHGLDEGRVRFEWLGATRNV